MDKVDKNTLHCVHEPAFTLNSTHMEPSPYFLFYFVKTQKRPSKAASENGKEEQLSMFQIRGYSEENKWQHVFYSNNNVSIHYIF